MNWAVGATTAPRPKPTLKRTLDSLRRAGWSEYVISEDASRVGQFPNWMNALRLVLDRWPEADAYFLIEDDVVFCRKLRAYLEHTLWPANVGKVALCSVYTPSPYVIPHVAGRVNPWGFNQQRRGLYLVGALAWVLPPNSARAVLSDLKNCDGKRGADYLVGKWAQETKRSVWYHNPSLAQHIGVGNSAIGDTLDGPLRRAADFIGEDAIPRRWRRNGLSKALPCRSESRR